MEPRQVNTLARAVTGAYRRGWLPARGYGQLFSRTPAGLWGGHDVLIQTEVGELAIPLREVGARQLLVFGRIMHERGETELMRRLLPNVGTFIDIGANYGWYARLARDLSKGAVVVAAEANPRLIPYLKFNLEPGAEVMHVAVGEKSGLATFYVSANSALSSPNRMVGDPVTVEAITLDQISDRIGKVPDIVKCDVEGGEMAVLRGAEQVRSADLPPIWLMEADEQFLTQTGGSYDELHRELTRFGPVRYYRAAPDGSLISLPGLGAFQGTEFVNVLVVPEKRNGLVESAFV
jgi:FkbM family methyltransferase